MNLLAAVVFTVTVSSCYGQAAILKPYNETALHMFIPVDTNGDGIMSIDELEASFDKYDTNGNGQESRHEYTEYICAVTPELYQLSHYLYDEYDYDGDHHLTRSDYDQLHAAMDGDSDGDVSLDEFITYWEIIFPKYEQTGPHSQTHAHGHSACH